MNNTKEINDEYLCLKTEANDDQSLTSDSF